MSTRVPAPPTFTPEQQAILERPVESLSPDEVRERGRLATMLLEYVRAAILHDTGGCGISEEDMELALATAREH